jgi:hypothetical protein
MARPKKQIFTPGVIEDPRPQEAKDKDYKHEELATATPFVWKEVPQAEWRQYTIFSQDGSGSCLTQATGKAIGIERKLKSGKFVFYSPRFIYIQRTNTGPGMYLVEALNIPCKAGIPVEQLLPSQNLSEAQMNDASDRNEFVDLEALVSKADKFITMTIPDIDAIANIVEPNGKPVVITVRFAMDEWNQQVPTINPNANANLYHGIVVTQATLYNGKKCLIIDDSWGTGYGIGGKRIVSEDWFKANRVTGAGYFTKFAQQGGVTKPIHTFTRQLAFGLKADTEVMALQQCLNFLGYFPDVQAFTGNYFGLTQSAVKTFQTNYGIQGTGVVGPITMAKLNSIFTK